jgi:hypothetical protein
MATKSGKSWVTWANENATASDKLDDLETSFRTNVKDFIAALEKAGATVLVTETKRSAKRAYLFHWSWKIALGKCKASDAAAMDGVDIQWDHGKEDESKKGAQEMVDGFGLAVPPASTNPPATTSNHIEGKAVDMNITWAGTIKVRDKTGADISMTFMADTNANTTLHTVGQTYGVKKLTTDAPHWSVDGH